MPALTSEPVTTVDSARPMADLGAGTERGRVLELVRRHGWNATAFQTLEDGYAYHFVSTDGCVAYVDTGAAWVAAGAPICAADALPEAVSSFVRAAAAVGKRACFFAAEERLLAASGALEGLRIGEQPEWDPRSWRDTLRARRSLREQLRRARAKGVVVREATAAELAEGPVRDAIERLASRWLDTRAMAPMGFLVRLEPFTFPRERRCFLAEAEGRLVAFAGVIPVPARGGWFVEDLVRDPDAPNGTAELLVDAVMRWAEGHACDWVTLGLAPLAGDVSAPLRIARVRGRRLYDFEGVRAYKAKLAPRAWIPIFLAFPRGQSPLATVVDALAAFTHGGFVRFGMRSFFRGPKIVLLGLAAMLVPWTVLLGWSPERAWGGHPALKWGWVAFDAALAAALFVGVTEAGGKRARTWFGALFAIVVVDTVATWIEVVLFHLPRATGAFEHALLGVACAVPTVAALVLAGTRARAARRERAAIAR